MIQGETPVASHRQIALRFFRFGMAFWRGETAPKASGLSAGLLLATFALVGCVLLINSWMAVFFNAIAARDGGAILSGLVRIVAPGAGAALAAGVAAWMKLSLQIAWREFLTRRLLDLWISNGSAHRIATIGQEIDAPEFRIAEDVRMASDTLVDFAASLTNASISAVAFVAVLWTVGGTLTIGGPAGVAIPGYLVWLAILYSLVLSGGVAWLGRPLVGASERKNAAEAALRSDMVDLGEVPVDVSLHGGDNKQRSRVQADVESLFARWRRIVRYQSLLAIGINANVTFMPIVPLLAAAPKYLDGDISLGGVIQASAAFVQAQLAFNWFFDNYIRIAEWLANIVRVVSLLDALERPAPETTGRP